MIFTDQVILLCVLRVVTEGEGHTTDWRVHRQQNKQENQIGVFHYE